jgi:hypothetical protein
MMGLRSGSWCAVLTFSRCEPDPLRWKYRRLWKIEGISAMYKIGSSFLAIAPSLRFDGGGNYQTA